MLNALDLFCFLKTIKYKKVVHSLLRGFGFGLAWVFMGIYK
ncbi:hypothetical protein SAMN04488516_1162 [Desulfonauticus submarinus]|uniref:Uncharacterized protein n=1 Tax=Desulfonauticus submarinus TaxID=206665 RepID=A0A1H0G198_9BACT|nr:hypothetical protein SAMN04488516_1162 [Desulfonauticus submarinus]